MITLAEIEHFRKYANTTWVEGSAFFSAKERLCDAAHLAVTRIPELETARDECERQFQEQVERVGELEAENERLRTEVAAQKAEADKWYKASELWTKPNHGAE